MHTVHSAILSLGESEREKEMIPSQSFPMFAGLVQKVDELHTAAVLVFVENVPGV